MVDHSVLVVGGGPTGIVLAAELALAGVDVGIVERSVEPAAGSRAGGLHARTLELLDQRGVVDRFLAAGKVMQVAGFAMVRLDLSDAPSRHPYGLALWQNEVERLLAGWVAELGVPWRRGQGVTGIGQDHEGVDVRLDGGGSLRAAYAVGCDGGRSAVRTALGIPFTGWAATTSTLVAEVRLVDPPEWGGRYDARGFHGLGPLEDGWARAVVREGTLRRGAATVEDLRAALTDVWGSDLGLHDARWVSRFTDAARQAQSYRERRVLLAGDAAHVHPPAGGQGLGLGVQDAVNLGWKLAQVVRGTSPDALLDSYQAEQHPVADRVLRHSLAQMALLRGDDGTRLLRDAVAAMLAADEPRRRFAAQCSGLDVAYDLGEGSPLLGRRVPDLDLDTPDGPTTVSRLLHAARPVLLDLAGGLAGPVRPWADRVRVVRAQTRDRWALPVLGEVAAPSAVLVRPDGHVAWVSEGSVVGLVEALTSWFGPPKRA